MLQLLKPMGLEPVLHSERSPDKKPSIKAKHGFRREDPTCSNWRKPAHSNKTRAMKITNQLIDFKK